jgi:hypothetical protein
MMNKNHRKIKAHLQAKNQIQKLKVIIKKNNKNHKMK